MAALMLAALARAEGHGLPNLKNAAGSADTIVVGAASLQTGGAGGAVIRIRVDRVLTGKVVAGSSITVARIQPGPRQYANQVQSPGTPFIAVPQNNEETVCREVAEAPPVHAIWFLEAGAGGTYTFAKEPPRKACEELEPEYSTVAGALPSAWSYDASLPVVDKLAYEVGYAFDRFAGEGPFAMELNPALIDEASKATRTAVYRLLAASIAQPVAMAGLMGRMRDGDGEALEQVASSPAALAQQAVPTQVHMGNQILRSVPRGEPGPAGGPSVMLLAMSVARVHDGSAATVGRLGRLLENQAAPVPLQHAAAEALQHVHTASAVEVMAPYLNNPDPVLRDFAIGTLACFVNAVPLLDHTHPQGSGNINLPGPLKTADTMSHFVMGDTTIDRDPEPYRNYWSEWWTAHSLEVGKMAAGES